MPELSLVPQFLCDAAALQERGDAVTFELLEWGRIAAAFAVRYDHVAVAYLNRCAHVPSELDWQPGKFFDMDKRFIICAVHGALYEPATGQCVGGPCPGARLQALCLKEERGQVFWCPTERFQPLP